MNDACQSSLSLKRVVALLALFGLPVVIYFAWEFYNVREPVTPVNYDQALTRNLKYLGDIDKLAPRFRDVNGDLLADAPGDVAQQLDPTELVYSPGVGLDTEADWSEWIEHLGKATGKKVVFRAVEDPKVLLEEIGKDQIHITSFNTGYIPAAVNVAGFVPLVALADAEGKSTYQMEIIVPTGSAIKSVGDIQGRVVTFTSTGSHSGYKAPLILLRDEFGLRPGRDYEFVMSGGHAQSMKQLAKDPKLIAAVAGDLLADAAGEGRIIAKEQYRSIYQSKPFPRGAWGVTSKLKPELTSKIKEAFLGFQLKGSRLEGKFKGSRAVKFVPVDYKSDWAYVREQDEKMLKW